MDGGRNQARLILLTGVGGGGRRGGGKGDRGGGGGGGNALERAHSKPHFYGTIRPNCWSYDVVNQSGNMMLNVHRNHKAYYGRGEWGGGGGGGAGGGGGGGGREII